MGVFLGPMLTAPLVLATTEIILAKLSDSARVFAFDIDPSAIAVGRELEKRDSRFHIFHRPYTDMGKVLQGEDIHGILFDPGISQLQAESLDRGFSSLNWKDWEDGPMDMRMNSGAGETAAEWLQRTSVEELAWVFNPCGPDFSGRMAERIAQAIMDDQAANGPFTSIARFAEVVGRTVSSCTQDPFAQPYGFNDHPARFCLRKIRSYLNQESEQFASALPQAFGLLVPGGRCVAKAWTNWEDSADTVMQFVIDHQEPDEDTVAKIKKKRRLRELYPLLGTDLDYSVLLVESPIKATGERETNMPHKGRFFVLEKGPRRVKHIKAKARLERSRFKQPPTPMFVGASPEDAPDDKP